MGDHPQKSCHRTPCRIYEEPLCRSSRSACVTADRTRSWWRSTGHQCQHVSASVLWEDADTCVRSLSRVLSWVRAFQGQVYILCSHSLPALRNSFQTAFFDVPLHDNFHHASRRRFDLRRILDNTLLKARPNDAVTFVDNHE